jgi:hypothetical protein
MARGYLRRGPSRFDDHAVRERIYYHRFRAASVRPDHLSSRPAAGRKAIAVAEPFFDFRFTRGYQYE